MQHVDHASQLNESNQLASRALVDGEHNLAGLSSGDEGTLLRQEGFFTIDLGTPQCEGS